MAKTDCKPLPPLSEKDIARFWKHIDRRGPDDCWPWTGPIAQGYGKFTVTLSAHNYRQIRSARVAMYIATGIDPFPLFACHLCDVRYAPGDLSYRKCCNPSHLVAGNQRENLAHMSEVGRSQKGYRRTHPERIKRGEAQWCSILHERDVIEIRKRYASGTVFQYVLAAEFGVGQSHISQIIRRAIWKHLP